MSMFGTNKSLLKKIKEDLDHCNLLPILLVGQIKEIKMFLLGSVSIASGI